MKRQRVWQGRVGRGRGVGGGAGRKGGGGVGSLNLEEVCLGDQGDLRFYHLILQ